MISVRAHTTTGTSVLIKAVLLLLFTVPSKSLPEQKIPSPEKKKSLRTTELLELLSFSAIKLLAFMMLRYKN